MKNNLENTKQNEEMCEAYNKNENYQLIENKNGNEEKCFQNQSTEMSKHETKIQKSTDGCFNVSNSYKPNNITINQEYEKFNKIPLKVDMINVQSNEKYHTHEKFQEDYITKTQFESTKNTEISLEREEKVNENQLENDQITANNLEKNYSYDISKTTKDIDAEIPANKYPIINEINIIKENPKNEVNIVTNNYDQNVVLTAKTDMLDNKMNENINKIDLNLSARENRKKYIKVNTPIFTSELQNRN